MIYTIHPQKIAEAFELKPGHGDYFTISTRQLLRLLAFEHVLGGEVWYNRLSVAALCRRKERTKAQGSRGGETPRVIAMYSAVLRLVVVSSARTLRM